MKIPLCHHVHEKNNTQNMEQHVQSHIPTAEIPNAPSIFSLNEAKQQRKKNSISDFICRSSNRLQYQLFGYNMLQNIELNDRMLLW